MKRVILSLVSVMMILMMVAACKNAAVTTPSQATSSTGPPESPVHGGNLIIVSGWLPMALNGGAVGPSDLYFVAPGLERLMDTAPDRSQGVGLEPVLAEKVDDDIANKRIIFHLRPGVKFHDGTDLNADAVIWNFQNAIDSKALEYANYWRGIKKLDDLTVEIDYTQYTNQLIQSWGIMAITSEAAYKLGSGGDPAKGEEWNRTHCVGTGPFILKEFRPDDHMTWVRNPNYWQTGKPHLDEIEFLSIPDEQTQEMMMQSGEADYMLFPPGNPASYPIFKQGYKVVSNFAGIISEIYPNTADPKSKWNDIRLRQALEYALDKAAIVKAFGEGFLIPMTMLAPPGEWGYDPNYPSRNYDPQKARDLIKAAGYNLPLKAQLLLLLSGRDIGTVVKQYLDAAGFQIDLDVADPGRYYNTFFGQSPGPDLVLGWSGTDINYLLSYMRWFSTDPFTNVAYLGRTPEQKALDVQVETIPDAAGQKAMMQKIIRYMTDEARVIPICFSPIYCFAAPYVHPAPTLGIHWPTEDIWVEKRK
jgi:peptide/nickel transport system substrate-binding protein